MKSRKVKILALIMALTLLALAACSNKMEIDEDYEQNYIEELRLELKKTTRELNDANAKIKELQAELAAFSNSSATTPPQSSENVREVNKPSELIGTPDRIYIVQGKNERTIEPGTDEYNEILELLRGRFPEKLKEAARAITWADETGFNRDMMREEFDFLELSYEKAQTVKLNCMNKDDYPLKEITFEMMIFPLSEITGTVSIDTHKTSGFVGRSYGPLEDSAEIIAELLGYVD